MKNASFFAMAALSAVLLSGCVRDACNNECGVDEVCDEQLVACVPAGSDAGSFSCDSDDDCSGARPLCDPESERCVACLSGSDCPSNRCDPLTLTCLSDGCNSAADCTDESLPYCGADGSCIECRTSGDCAPLDGQRRTCDLGTRRCVANPCRQDADCSADPGGRVCDTGSGLCVECTSSEQCATGVCLQTAKVCVECLENSDCQEDVAETCNTTTNQCVVTGCVTDAQCKGATRCDSPARTCVGCLSNDDCSFGGECVDSTCRAPDVCVADSDCLWPGVCVNSECVSCRSDGDCRTGQSCVDGACLEPAVCAVSSECGPGRICQEGSCVESGCLPDAFEPNGTAETASPLSVGTIVGVLCPNEEDLYSVRLQEGVGLQARVAFDPAVGRPSLEIVAGLGGPVLVTEERQVSAGIIIATLERAGQGTDAALIRVHGGSGVRVPYTLTTTLSVSGLCEDDRREMDNSQSLAKLTVPGVYEGVLCPSRGSLTELDWFAVDVDEGEQVQAELVLLSGGGESAAEVEIHSMQNGLLVRESAGPSLATSTSVAPAGGKRYWVVVRNQQDSKHLYSLKISTGLKPPPNDLCEDDGASLPILPANTLVESHTRGAGDEGESSCGGAGADNFWRLELSEPASVRLVLNADFDALLSLQSSCDPASELACVGTAAEGARELSFEGLGAGVYIVRVDGLAGASGTYSLRSILSPTSPPPAGESCANAQPLVFSEDVATISGQLALASDDVAAGCGVEGNDAVWAFTLEEEKRVRATLTAFEGASVSLVPAGACGSSSLACVSAGAQESTVLLDKMVVPAGEWRLVVDGASARRGAFSMRVELSEALHPPETDTCESVLPLEAVVSADTRGAADDFEPVCASASHAAGDAVWRLTLVEEEEVELVLDAQFDATLSLTGDGCATAETLACADGPSARLLMPALAPGEYYVWVDGYADAGGPFTLTTHRRAAEPVPPNDLCQNAELVDPSGGPVVRSSSTRRASNEQQPAGCFVGGVALDTDGRDVSYRVSVPPAQTLVATLSPGDFDGSLYILEACGEEACLGGADASFLAGGVETLSLKNESPAPVEWIVVVDSWNPGASGSFDIQFELR